MISFTSPLENIDVIFRSPKIFFWIAVSVADAAAVNPNGSKMLLTNGLRTFPIKGKPVFSNGQRSPLTNPPNCTF